MVHDHIQTKKASYRTAVYKRNIIEVINEIKGVKERELLQVSCE